jgi:predicted dithiol-disulfide oxidoreductase (DUF899 family)
MTKLLTGTRKEWLAARLELLAAEKAWLDRAPRGRNENGMWWRRHGEYGKG